ncbi:MAG: hypothetical protein ABUL49_00985, partial [bacterium]
MKVRTIALSTALMTLGALALGGSQDPKPEKDPKSAVYELEMARLSAALEGLGSKPQDNVSSYEHAMKGMKLLSTSYDEQVSE